MSPLPNTHVIHPQMLPTLRPVAVAAQTGTGRLLTPTAGTYDSGTGRTAAGTSTLVYEGSCRVQPRSRLAQPVAAGEQPVTVPEFQITVPSSVAAAPNMQWLMTACEDAQLVGKTFTVVEVAYGTLELERRLMCSLNETDG